MSGVLNEIYIFKTLALFQFLGPFAKLRKATINFVMSVQISYLGIFENLSRKFKFH